MAVYYREGITLEEVVAERIERHSGGVGFEQFIFIQDDVVDSYK